MVFPSGLGFHSARHIDGEWAHQSHGLGYIFWRQTTRQYDRPPKFLGGTSQLPVKFRAAAAQPVWHKTVEQPGGSWVLRQLLQRCGVSDPKGLDGSFGELTAKIGRLVPVKLQSVQPTFLHGAPDEILRRIHKHTHRRHERWQVPDNLRGGSQRDMTGAWLIKHEPQSIRSGVHRSQRIAYV